MNNQEQISAKEQILIKQARKVAIMRRKNVLWKELLPELNRMNATVRAIEKLELATEVKPKTKSATA